MSGVGCLGAPAPSLTVPPCDEVSCRSRAIHGRCHPATSQHAPRQRLGLLGQLLMVHHKLTMVFHTA